MLQWSPAKAVERCDGVAEVMAARGEVSRRRVGLRRLLIPPQRLLFLVCVCVCLFIYFVFGFFVGFAKLEVKVRPSEGLSGCK